MPNELTISKATNQPLWPTRAAFHKANPFQAKLQTIKPSIIDNPKKPTPVPQKDDWKPLPHGICQP